MSEPKLTEEDREMLLHYQIAEAPSVEEMDPASVRPLITAIVALDPHELVRPMPSVMPHSEEAEPCVIDLAVLRALSRLAARIAHDLSAWAGNMIALRVIEGTHREKGEGYYVDAYLLGRGEEQARKALETKEQLRSAMETLAPEIAGLAREIKRTIQSGEKDRNAERMRWN